MANAGQAYLASIANDPKSKAALSRALKRLTIFAKAVEQLNPDFESLLADYRRQDGEAARAWETEFRAEFPREIEDVIRAAKRAEVPSDYLLAGTWTYADLFPHIEGHLQNRRDKTDTKTDTADLLKSNDTATRPPTTTRPMSLAEAGTLNGYAPNGGSKAARRKAAGQALKRAIGSIWHEKVGMKYIFDKTKMKDA